MATTLLRIADTRYWGASRRKPKSLNIAKKLPQRDSLANVLNSIGVLYLEQEEYDKAKANLEQSLEIYQAIKNQTEEARTLLNLGVLEQRRGHFDESLSRFDASRNLAILTASKDVEIAVGEGMGVVYREQKKYEAALSVLDRSLLLADEIGDRLRIAEVTWRKAELKYDVGAFVESAKLAEKAYQIAHQMRAPKLSYLTATTLGKVYRAQGKMGEAFQTLSRAVDHIESMREQIVGQELEQQLYFETKVSTYHELIDLLVAQNREVNALTFAERAKGRVLLDVLSKGRVAVQVELTKQERGEERRLNQKIIQLNNALREERLNTKTDYAKINAFNQQLDVARSQYSSFQDVLQATHPDFRLRRGVIPSITFGSLNSLFNNRETVYLDYVVAKERAFLFLLCKSPQSENPSLRVISINISEKRLTKLVTGFHQAIAEHRVIFSPQGKELYDLLIKPIESYLHGKDALYILPDNILWDLPFQALQNANGRYLLEDIAISYAPSLSVLVEMSKKKVKSKPSLLSFGNPQTEQNRMNDLQELKQGKEFKTLPAAEREVKSVARLFDPKQRKTFLGANASEGKFKSLAAGFNTLHFATHGVLDNRQPLYSYLLLANSDGDGKEDGLLEAREIMNLDLRADLAVLSACQTARGRIGAGEGVIGMSWAFFVAGCQTIVVSQWEVDSESAADLMVGFFTTLKWHQDWQNVSKAKALRLSALKLMKRPRYEHPYYWAGFVSVGNN